MSDSENQTSPENYTNLEKTHKSTNPKKYTNPEINTEKS